MTCAYPGCREPLFASNALRGTRSLNSRIAHICARREGGPRWDPDMGAEDNRSAENLILLCIRHAAEIDLLDNVANYPVELLRQWKATQLDEFDAALGGWSISDQEAADAIAGSIAMAVTLQAETINLGGAGGNAPAAAGGGGAAVGPGSLGGPGGSVGQINLDGEPGRFPGAGGGGGGTIAPNAIRHSARSDRDATEGVGWSRGTDGQDGGDTSVSLGDEVLLRASGRTRRACRDWVAPHI